MTTIQLCMLAAAATLAQVPQSTTPATPSAVGSIRGVVRDSITGDPLPGAQVRISVNPAQPIIQITADEQGRYELLNIQPGRITVGATPRSDAQGTPFTVRVINLASAQDLTGIDIKIRAQAELAGRIIDENNQPVPGIAVRLVSREYSLGTLRYIGTANARTDDQGQYLLKSVDPGRSYFLLALSPRVIRNPISDAPDDPQFRKPTVVPTYYPGTDSLAGAQPLILRPGERRENVDLRISHSPSYCAAGVLRSGNGTEALRFEITESQPTPGAIRTLSVVVNWRLLGNGVLTGPGGKFRVCDLHPGDYRFSVYSDVPDGANNPAAVPLFYGTAELTVTDKDVNDISVLALPHVAVPGEVAWDAAPPGVPVPATLTVRLDPIVRTPRREEVLSARSNVPGNFSFEGLLIGDYSVQVTGPPPGAYVKNVTYDGKSVLNEPLQAGTAVGEATLRVILARDGGRLSVSVADKDDHPVADAVVVVAPVTASSEVGLASFMSGGYTDQNGAWTSALHEPGKYYVLATLSAVDFSAETVAKLWRARSKAQEVDIAPGATVKVSLVPITPE